MTDTQRAVLAFVLIALILLLYGPMVRRLSPPQPMEPPPEQRLLFQPADSLPPLAAPPPVSRRAVAAPALTPPASAPLVATAERSFSLETPLYRATISSLGGGALTYFELKEYQHGSGTGNVQLITDNGAGVNLHLAYINLVGDSIHLTQNFDILSAPRTEHTYLEEGSLTVAYRYTFPSGSQIIKRLTFHSDRYTVPVSIEWLYPEREIGPSASTFEIAWPGGLASTERVRKEDEIYSKAYVFQGGELADQGKARRGKPVHKNFVGNTDWVALRNKYFAAAFIADPQQPGAFGALRARFESVTGTNGKEEAVTRHGMALGYDARRPVSMTLYLGPLSYFIIRDLDVGLQRIMNLGFSLIRPISTFVLYSLVFLHGYLPNYGVVLILFAVAIRVLTNPLTKKSAISTQKMQLVQPRLKELQAKYKGNQQKLSKETMALWKSEGVNPLGGCLPILIQLPLLWALFIVFRTTIELRGQPFILWVTDLSAPDVVFTLPFSLPLYGSGVTILALIMCVTMFVQQKLSGMSNNPQQKPMMYMMTGMFFLIFNTFPSGLNLYYAFSNILGIFQQRNIRRKLQAGQLGTTGTKSK